MEEEKKKFRALVTYTVSGYIELEAEDEDEDDFLLKAETVSTNDVTDKEYVDCTWDVDVTSVEEL